MSVRLQRVWSAVASQASRAAMWIALFSLLAGVALMAAVLIYAYLQGDRAFEYWGQWSLHHGPWRYTFGIIENPKRKWLSVSFVLLIVSVQVSTFSALLGRDRRSLILAGCSLVSVWSAFYFLYWLID